MSREIGVVVMAVGTDSWLLMHVVKGVKLGVASAGIKAGSAVGERNDLLLLSIDAGASVSGVFTKNAFCAAPVLVAREHLASSEPRYFVINSGNANACTGEQGEKDARATCAKVAELAGQNTQSVLPFSTGVIGEYLPMSRLLAVLPKAVEGLGEDNWELAARAIMTTDTRPKGASVKVSIAGEEVVVTGIAKGAGMIRPNMATMLAYIATDATLEKTLLDDLLKYAVNKSFNRISIDGDTSTNDACMLIATGHSNAPEITVKNSDEFEVLQNAVVDVLQALAQSIVRDGEGATKFVAIQIDGGGSSEECLKVAYSIAHSPLVKTALFASDPNWGRIVAAIGYAGVEGLDANCVRVWLDDVLIVENGGRAQAYREEHGVAVVEKTDFTIKVDLGRGSNSETVWTSDLSHEYVTINAEYRT